MGGTPGPHAVRLVLLRTLPVPVVAGLSTVVELAAVAVLLAWTVWYRRRVRAGAEAPREGSPGLGWDRVRAPPGAP
ncbi:hypothetical protein [Saccharothrix sp. ST-888]|uniref:hypothetical protein n=1 Tax=Saccharothrix sp. ST-888 TaxID=1427391 RepID=UPI0012E04A9E|nr:hypothetical protein [Saccharothrix sp. ST-888]